MNFNLYSSNIRVIIHSTLVVPFHFILAAQSITRMEFFNVILIYFNKKNMNPESLKYSFTKSVSPPFFQYSLIVHRLVLWCARDSYRKVQHVRTISKSNNKCSFFCFLQIQLFYYYFFSVFGAEKFVKNRNGNGNYSMFL